MSTQLIMELVIVSQIASAGVTVHTKRYGWATSHILLFFALLAKTYLAR